MQALLVSKFIHIGQHELLYDHQQQMCYCWCVSSHVDHQVHRIGFNFIASELSYSELLNL